MDIETINKVLSALFVNSELVNFEYWSEFIIRFQRDNIAKSPAIKELWADTKAPSLFCFRFRSRWWIGKREEWERQFLA
jgi:hypothetical protein